MNLRIGLTRDHPAFNNSRQFSSCRRLETHFGRCVFLSNGEWRGIPRWLGWHGLMRRTFSPSLLLGSYCRGRNSSTIFVNIKVGAQHVENAYSIIDLLLRSAVMTRKVRSHSQHPAMVAISQPFVALHNKVICEADYEPIEELSPNLGDGGVQAAAI
jgi:hypothetical protein